MCVSSEVSLMREQELNAPSFQSSFQTPYTLRGKAAPLLRSGQRGFLPTAFLSWNRGSLVTPSPTGPRTSGRDAPLSPHMILTLQVPVRTTLGKLTSLKCSRSAGCSLHDRYRYVTVSQETEEQESKL